MKRMLVSFLLILCLVSGLCGVLAEEQPIAVGEKVVFGSFDQDNDPENGQEPLSWLVLDEKDGDLMLLSVYGLVPKAYHAPAREAVTWETCTLREWLNGEFFETAFTPEEQEAVLLTLVDNSAAQCNPAWKTDGGNDTEDRVYLLSWYEVGVYFPKNAERYCIATDSAYDWAFVNPHNGRSYWWSRSPGMVQHYACEINNAGDRDSGSVNDPRDVVRPVIWVKAGSVSRLEGPGYTINEKRHK